MMEKNIGLFNESFPPVMDGVAICVQNYARWMQELVGGVSVVVPRKVGTEYPNTPYEILSYAALPVPMRPPYVTGIAQLDPILRAKLTNREYKIIHAHTPFMAGSLGMEIAHSQKIPLVATFHSKYRDDFSRVIAFDTAVDAIIAEIVKFYQKADEVWVPQESVKEVLHSYGYKGNIEVVSNGCDMVDNYPEEFFTSSRASLGLAEGELALLFVGQHIWEKNVRLIINTLGRIKDLPYRMFFIGTGYAEKDMKELVESLGISDKVTFLGRQTDRELLKRYYAASDLFLFPSKYDTDGLVVREAAALNTPSIMLRTASASGMLTDGQTGFLIDESVDAFEALIRSLYADRQTLQRVGRAASGSIVRSWKDIAGEVIDRYNSIIARKTQIRKI